jgi:rare lipoprotein A
LRIALAAALVLALAGCATAPPPKTSGPDKPGTFGKYYADDGPPLEVPADLARVPDAVPRDEPFHKYANRPYTVFGRTYVPVVNRDATKERGLASWYGRKFHGQKTSSGEVYDMFAMTAAHKTLPIPSYAKVTNVKNGLSVVVRVNDRGPFHSNRIIDLSFAAASRIGIAAAGSGLVEVERIFAAPGVLDEMAPANVLPTPPPPILASVQAPVISRESTSLWLQLGAFSSVDGAESFREHVARELAWNLEPIEIASRDGVHRVRLGPYRNAEEAAAIGEKVRKSLGIAPVVTAR